MTEAVIADCRFEAPLSDAAFEELRARLALCCKVRFVEWTASYVHRDGTRALLVFRGADAGSIRNALRSAGVQFEAVTPVHER